MIVTTKKEFVNLLVDTFESLKERVNAYNLGIALVKKLGKEFKPMIQQGYPRFSSYFSDLLVELFYPDLDESLPVYKTLRKSLFDDLVSGIVKGANS